MVTTPARKKPQAYPFHTRGDLRHFRTSLLVAIEWLRGLEKSDRLPPGGSHSYLIATRVDLEDIRNQYTKVR